jgi:hypothetical protein
VSPAEPGTGVDTLVGVMVGAAHDWDNPTIDPLGGPTLLQRYAMVCAQLDAVCNYVLRLQSLVRWFDLTYGDNVPIWQTHTLDGQELPDNVELTETYRGVIGDKSP